MAARYALNGLSILVVEDDPLIALELAALFQSAGAQVLSLRTLAEAAAAVALDGVCAAVLDYRLGDDNVATLCEALKTPDPIRALQRLQRPPGKISNLRDPAKAGAWRDLAGGDCKNCCHPFLPADVTPSPVPRPGTRSGHRTPAWAPTRRRRMYS